MGRRTTANITSFNGGEVSPRLHGRPDLQVYQISSAEMLGWLPTVQGPALAAPGTLFVAKAKGPCRLIPFEFNPTQGYVLEFSASAIRFYTNDAQIKSAGAPYEVASPYSLTDAQALDYQQSEDVLYLTGAGKQPRKLSRTGAETFSIATLNLQNGPIGDGNGDRSITVSASGTTGTVTLTASSAIFAPGDVGGFFEIEAADFNDVPSWEAGITVNAGDKRTWSGKVYQCAGGAARTGTLAPSHDSGTEWDGSGSGTDINAKGPYGVKWTFLYGRFGLLKITGYTASTTVTATVIKPLADSLTTTASWRWAFGAFSDSRGWPDRVCYWNECLVLCKGNRAYVSVVGDLENFERRDSSGDFQRDLSGSFALPNPAAVKWCAADRLLLIGTEREEYTVERILTQTGTAGPPVFEIRRMSQAGSAGAKPVQTDGRILFVQRAGRKLLEYGYSLQSDRYTAPNLTRRAEHIAANGKEFVEIAWAQEPERILWAVRRDGTLAGMVYDPDEQVLGWFRRALGAGLSATSLCAITDPEGRRDQIWIAATAGSETWVMRMAKIWETGDDPTEAVYVDASAQYEGVASTTITGLTWLEGKPVQVLADAKPHPDRVVKNGAIALDFAAEKVSVGLAFPARLTPLKIEAGQDEGTAQTKLQRIVEIRLRLAEAQGIRVSIGKDEPFPLETRENGDPMDEAVPLFTGDTAPITLIGEYQRGATLTIERYQPTPATLLAIVAPLVTGER